MQNRIVYGDKEFTHDQIKSGNCYLAVSLISDSLEFNTLSVVVETTDNNIRNFRRDAPLEYYYGARRVGLFYVQSIERETANQYKIYAISTVGLLDARKHYGGMYSGQTAGAVIADICGGLPVNVQGRLAERKLYGWLPYSDSARSNLAQVLFAIGGTVKTDLDGVIRIEELWSGTIGVIPDDKMFREGAVVGYDDRYSALILTEHQYIQGGEERTLFEGETVGGDVVTFDEPMYGLQASGFTILSSGPNHAVLSAGAGTLTGFSYVHNSREVRKIVDATAAENVKTISDATLISLANSVTVAERLAAYYRSSNYIQAGVVYDTQDPGDVMDEFDPFERQLGTACIQSLDINISGKLRATCKSLIGYRPPAPDDTQYYDYVEVLSGQGTWTGPEGITDITAVLIGKGQDGQAGQNGQPSENTKIIVTSEESKGGGTWSCSAGTPGVGGEGGEGGEGGKILRVEMEIPMSGGITYNTTADEVVFGEYTSANGTAMPSGYTDLLTGTVYAKRGNDGVKGGDGGDGGDLSDHTDGYDGESVYVDLGGKGSEMAEQPGVGLNRKFAGAGGGGAAYGAPGNNSKSCFLVGNGANASDGQDGKNYGCGGDGGNGGGGSGTNGAARITAEAGAAPEGIWYDPDNGAGGIAGAAGHGKSGCVLVYYRRPVPTYAGAFVEAGGHFMVDASGRLIIV